MPKRPAGSSHSIADAAEYMLAKLERVKSGVHKKLRNLFIAYVIPADKLIFNSIHLQRIIFLTHKTIPFYTFRLKREFLSISIKPIYL
jgi:hypothetical protein